MSIIEGTVVRFYTSQGFQTITGSAADPTTVKFAYSRNGATPTQFTYSSGSGLGVIVKDSVGVYHIDIDTSGKVGIWETAWVGLSTTGSVQCRSDLQVEIVSGNIAIV